MAELVENLRTALNERIDNLDWMGEDTKVNAKEKLMAFRPKIGYPDKWQSFDGLTINSDDLVGNVRNLREFFNAEVMQLLNGKHGFSGHGRTSFCKLCWQRPSRMPGFGGRSKPRWLVNRGLRPLPS